MQRIIAGKFDAKEVPGKPTRSRFGMFFLQCLVDLRIEPRWLPDYCASRQLRNELAGRILAAAAANPECVAQAGWQDQLLNEENDQSLYRQLDIALVFMPGPLEGGGASASAPEELVVKIRQGLAAPRVDLETFALLVSQGLIFHFPADIVDAVAAAIERMDYYIEPSADPGTLFSYLAEIAHLAAMHRSPRLALAVTTLLRKYRALYPKMITIPESFNIAMIAAASEGELAAWCSIVGEFITDLAFHDMTKTDAFELRVRVAILCGLVPQLWITCGAAEAALEARSNSSA